MGQTQIRGGQVLDLTLTDADFASANKDGTTGTYSLRTLGTGSQQAAAGDHTHAIGSSYPGATAGSVVFVGPGPVDAQDNANFYWDDTNHRLGLGTTAPGQTLDIAGNMQFSGSTNRQQVFEPGSNVGSTLDLDWSANVTTTTTAYRLWRSTNTSGNCFFQIFKADNTATIQHQLAANGTSFLCSGVGRKLGVGVTSPNERLDINGNLQFTDTANAQFMAIKTLTELTTIAASATTDTTLSIPANCLLVGISARVTVAIPTASTFTLTGASSGTALGSGSISTAANTTDAKARSYENGAAQKVRITPDLTPATNAGRVRITIHYIQISAPTS